MGLDESLFHRVHRWWQSRRRAAAAARELPLAPLEPMLRRLLPLLLGTDVRLVVGAGRATLGERVVLPASLPFASSPDDTEQVLLLRIALAAAAEATRTTGPAAAEPTARAAAMRQALPGLLQWLDSHWPSTRSLLPAAERHAAALGATPDQALLATFGALPQPQPAARPAAAPSTMPAPRSALPDGTERQQKQRRAVEKVELDRRDDGGNPLAHVFEKVKTAEEHTGGHRAMDGSDELDDHLEALEELDLQSVVRTNQATASVFRADLDVDAAFVETAGAESEPAAAIPYDEWDDHKRCYLPGWCSVREDRAPLPADPKAVQATIRAMLARHAALLRTLRGEFARLARGHSWQRRQPIGADIDVDAVVDRYASLTAARLGRGTAGEARLYVSRRPAPRDVATLVLLDRSLSSDSWVGGRRVLDTAREATLLLGEVLRDVRMPVAIATFCSHSRRDCRFDLVKDFDEDWQRTQPRLFGVRPDGYTRIGPAMRHATQLLARQHARRRLLFVVSDCKPVDYDHYEGRRGIGDVRQAIREARREDVHPLALAIDTRAGDHLARMFGPHGFRVLPDASALCLALARLHERLLR
jgi:nitric oxide reductase NorD protein